MIYLPSSCSNLQLEADSMYDQQDEKELSFD